MGGMKGEIAFSDGIELQEKKGCFVGRAKAVGLALLVAVIIIVVAVATYYGHPDYGKGDCPAEASPPEVTEPPVDDDSPMLPTTLLPLHYDIRLRPDIYKEDPDKFSLTGEVTFTFKVVTPTRRVTVHVRELSISPEIEVRHGEDKLVVVRTEEVADKEFFILHLEDTLAADQSYSVHMTYTGPLRKDLKGIYWSSYTDEGQTKYLIASQLQATDARKIFPCFDEPALKATFKISMEYQTPMKTLGNMEIIQTDILNDGWKRDVYGATPVMSTYLLAFIVSEFECRSSTTSNGKKVNVCTRPNAVEQVEYALQVAGPIQEFFEGYHEIEYPLPKTVHAAVPDFAAGAMENWGLIIYRETALLYDERVSSASFRQRVLLVIAHELAHMWFGNLVTCKWWDDIWLNEGFASYMENLGMDSQYTTASGEKYWQMEAQFVTDNMQYVMGLDGLTSSHPVYQPVYHPDEIIQIFDGITYYKGSSVIRMMNFFLGEPTFKKGITNYLNRNRYGVTTHTQLFDFLTEQAKSDGVFVDVSLVMDTWIKQMGYPVVHFKVKDGRLHVSQEHFLFSGPKEGESLRESPYNYTWIVPITFLTDSTQNPDNLKVHWLFRKEGEIALEETPGWILGNYKQRFFYRVNYDMDNWERLLAQLNSDHTRINLINRAQLIDDAFSLGRAGLQEQVLGLKVVEYMQAEQDYIPWRALSFNIAYIRSMMVGNQENYKYLQNFMNDTLYDISTRLGWTETEDLDRGHLQRRLRPVIQGMACSFGMPTCLQQAAGLFADWMNGARLSVNLARSVSCYGIKAGGNAQWQWLLERYKNSNSGSEKVDIMTSLGCSANMTQLLSYLTMLKDGEVFRDQDAGTVIGAVTSNPRGKVVAWNFVKDHWDRYFLPTLGKLPFALAGIVSRVTGGFSSEAELTELEAFMESHPEQGAASQAFKVAVESTKANIAWRARSEEAIVDWLKLRE